MFFTLKQGVFKIQKCAYGRRVYRHLPIPIWGYSKGVFISFSVFTCTSKGYKQKQIWQMYTCNNTYINLLTNRSTLNSKECLGKPSRWKESILSNLVTKYRIWYYVNLDETCLYMNKNIVHDDCLRVPCTILVRTCSGTCILVSVLKSYLEYLDE